MISCHAVPGIGEVRPGDDLAAMLATAGLRDGDVLVVTSKVVSKAEGQVLPGTSQRPADRSAAVAAETDRPVARRGQTAIVRTHHGLVMAAAGVDASNTDSGTLVLLPADPDGSARRLREAIAAGGGPNVAVVVSDTAGRAWRNGQTDLAVGAAGLEVLDDHAGRTDPYGNPLSVTAPAVADEIASAADLVKGKLAGTPVAVVRGLERRVLPRDRHGPGAAALVRPEAADMFGLGTREAVLRAVTRDDPRGFGATATVDEVTAALDGLGAAVRVRVEGAAAVEVELLAGTARQLGSLEERARVLAFAHGWHAPAAAPDTGSGARLRFEPATP